LGGRASSVGAAQGQQAACWEASLWRVAAAGALQAAAPACFAGARAGCPGGAASMLGLLRGGAALDAGPLLWGSPGSSGLAGRKPTAAAHSAAASALLPPAAGCGLPSW